MTAMQCCLASPHAVMMVMVQLLLLVLLGQADGTMDPCSESYPSIGFGFDAPDKTVVLTFDDGPDTDGATKNVLDLLSKEKIKATFFINTKNNMDVPKSSKAKALIKRMINEGHVVGDHSVTHSRLNNKNKDKIEEEFLGVQKVTAAIDPRLRRLTLFRAPYGVPYLNGGSDVKKVASVISKFAVHIGWQCSTKDFKSRSNKDAEKAAKKCVTKGIILMHTIPRSGNTGSLGAYPDALRDYIHKMKGQGYKFQTVEDYVYAKYGMSSAQVVNRFNSCKKPKAEDQSVDTQNATSTSTAVILETWDLVNTSTASQNTTVQNSTGLPTGAQDAAQKVPKVGRM